MRLGIAQDEVTIGVPAYRQPRQVMLGRILALPFRRQRPSFLLANGERLRRERVGGRARPAQQPGGNTQEKPLQRGHG